MTNRSKTKGTQAETAIVNTLIAAGAPHAERRALQGALDKGDIAGLPGICIESKNVAQMALAQWMKETVAEGINAHADIAVCWHKKRGSTNPLDWYVTMTGAQFIDVLRLTGHLPPKEKP